ncbi:MAG: hypothetical protein ACQERP_12405 [Pseudomonadota bacterium]
MNSESWKIFLWLAGCVAVAAFWPLLVLNSFYVSKWSAAWFQAIGSLLAVSVALALPFYQEYKKKIEIQEANKETERATLIYMHHNFYMLKSFLEMAGLAFQNNDGTMLGSLAYKNPGTYPELLIDQTSDFFHLFEKLSPRLQYDVSMAVSPARDLAMDINKMTKDLVDKQVSDPEEFKKILIEMRQEIKDKSFNNSRIGFYHVSKIMEEGNERFSEFSP